MQWEKRLNLIFIWSTLAGHTHADTHELVLKKHLKINSSETKCLWCCLNIFPVLKRPDVRSIKAIERAFVWPKWLKWFNIGSSLKLFIVLSLALGQLLRFHLPNRQCLLKVKVTPNRQINIAARRFCPSSKNKKFF